MRTAAFLSTAMTVMIAQFGSASAGEPAQSQALQMFIAKAKAIDTREVDTLAVQNNGRVKPLHSLARESILFIFGRYSKWGLSSSQIYLGVMAFPESEEIDLINVRSPYVRKILALDAKERFYSIKTMAQSPIETYAQELMGRGEKNLSENEKAVLETYHQVQLARAIRSGQHLIQAADFSALMGAHGLSEGGQVGPAIAKLVDALWHADAAGVLSQSKELKVLAANQPMPELFRAQVQKVGTEVVYNKMRPFFYSALCLMIAGLLVLFSGSQKWINPKWVGAFVLVPLVLQGVGFGLRVYLTGFAPVTNMYGTMTWVAFGVVLFSWILYLLYQQRTWIGALWLASAMILFLTESLPLVLSPDLDPVVAVLRSNLWLTMHVLTITISYAAFTIAMVMGNVVLVRSLFKKESEQALKAAAHSTYRMIQLGAFLISAGIVLGGIWADYSWGRFWGWDPKETWALIADLGYLAILHAKYVGWLGSFGILAASPAAYLLVIMAWYGVNFILATGLHSYGFSTGGAQAVGIFVAAQVALLIFALVKRHGVNLGRLARNQAK